MDEHGQDTHTNWNFYNSFFFAITVVTTIGKTSGLLFLTKFGYGHLAPSTAWGRVFCVLYAVVGVPMTGILLAGIGDHFARGMVRGLKRARGHRAPRLALAANLCTFLLPWLLVFLLLPAAVFMFTEDWSYLEGLYYCFITLATIGFGDYVAGPRWIRSQGKVVLESCQSREDNVRRRRRLTLKCGETKKKGKWKKKKKAAAVFAGNSKDETCPLARSPNHAYSSVNVRGSLAVPPTRQAMYSVCCVKSKPHKRENARDSDERRYERRNRAFARRVACSFSRDRSVLQIWKPSLIARKCWAQAANSEKPEKTKTT
ncbi:hypothetical protein HPB51_007121 [Rhipicephalus microplus]|uniref:Potassium channel domain-containing protein n=1 Tax=Rhipicephalus microplus TaxID=6941 RepID=A0A9J6DZ94_RHIMP|nr:hypothetical protein HPB51_007121 [Rhipicephalus microplus]